jgi:lipoprotein-releasing system permease protein
MFYPLPLYVGLRYVRSRSHGFFVSFITWVSLAGVCLGVAALIVILSVMNGMGSEIRSRMLSLASHATVTAPPAQLQAWPQLVQEIRQAPGVVGAAPYVQAQAMIGRGFQLTGVNLRGVLPAQEIQVADYGRYMRIGTLEELQPDSGNVVLGIGLAGILNARVGDDLTVLIPQTSGDGGILELKPRTQAFTVSGIFDVGVQEHDSALALINMQDAMQLLGTAGPTGLRLKFQDIFAAPAAIGAIAAQLDAAHGAGFTDSDWSRDNAGYFRAVRIEKTMMALILMLVVGVAAFNIVAALVMVVNEKRTDIAILRTLGLAPGKVIAIFLTQGIFIGWFGTLLGVALGLSVAFNVDVIVPFLENLFGARIFDPDLYYVSDVPSEVHGWQVVAIAAAALLLTLLATLYPSLRAARTEPADVLRYE